MLLVVFEQILRVIEEEGFKEMRWCEQSKAGLVRSC